MVPVYHKKCGAQTGWYLRDAPREPDILQSEDYVRMDGTHPIFGAIFMEKCPFCGEIMNSPKKLKRDFPGMAPAVAPNETSGDRHEVEAN